MITFLELVLIVVPITVYFAGDEKVISSTFALVVLVTSFIVLILELSVGWLIVIGVIASEFPEPSIFVGTEIWNLLVGPLILTLYVYVISEVVQNSPRV
ncbi:hypothetical protein [Vibrio neptunius]|uniref:Uncharacterized protein n=1 Tax=Vibrio neptunius TaxID=170651 RepID=A0ABS3A098_9VIBR|nr:hypothetical protein [Vibrio neptunius]KJY93077.1 hypothetical protein TW84_04180 [Vibrio neptunius]MBN3492649.1 hypothetical protein [Vibrio neptunius]MBN3515146.1 hypothetical protein [Vibrio neptunius]MBN3548978.1 hypothetical protein [Vibrio neptunius]MBN3577440.1 hypothetical protein [Vibrio neptunius]